MDFVDFNLSKKLKEKGFREKCFATYTPYSGTLKFNEINTDKRPASYKLNIEEFRECYNYYKENNIDAPAISQVLKWLRKEKKIFIGLYPMQAYDKEENLRWCADIYKTNNEGGLSCIEELYYQSYESAAIAGIEYVLDNLI